MNVLACPDDRLLAAYLAGDVSRSDLDEISTHIDVCPHCVSRLDRLESPFAIGSTAAVPHDTAFSEAVTKLLEMEKPLGPGSILRDYRILEAIGEGGMGTVFKARHERLDKIVALKVIRQGLLADGHALVRFEREMKAVGRLRDPNIVLATDAGEVDGVLFLVMEFVEGENLSKIVKKNGPLPEAKAREVIRQAALGLQHAHDAGLIHRDVKPSNLMLTPDGTVKILDLGLAVIAGDGTSDPDDSTEDGVKRAGDITSASRAVGTFDYMAPEQRQNAHAVDARVDVYGLGGTLWFLLTGQPPRNFANPPAGIVWNKFFAVGPTERYATAGSVAEAMAPARRKRWPRVAAVVLVIGCILAPFIYAYMGVVASSPGPGAKVVQTLWTPPIGKLPMTESEAAALQKTWTDDRKEQVLTENKLGMKLALIPPGEFAVSPECRVKISKPFRMGTTEVARGQFRKFADAENYLTNSERTGLGGWVFDRKLKHWVEIRVGITWREPGIADYTDLHPVNLVTHGDAVAFCKWLSKTEGKHYRLPTEAEWKWACRCGLAGPNPEIEDIDVYKKMSWFLANSKEQPQPVGLLKPNAWGLFDMFGNVSERTGDRYGPLPGGSFSDYAGVEKGTATTTVGSTFFSTIHDFSDRAPSEPGVAATYLGFRVVEEIQP